MWVVSGGGTAGAVYWGCGVVRCWWRQGGELAQAWLVCTQGCRRSQDARPHTGGSQAPALDLSQQHPNPFTQQPEPQLVAPATPLTHDRPPPACPPTHTHLAPRPHHPPPPRPDARLRDCGKWLGIHRLRWRLCWWVDSGQVAEVPLAYQPVQAWGKMAGWHALLARLPPHPAPTVCSRPCHAMPCPVWCAASSTPALCLCRAACCTCGSLPPDACPQHGVPPTLPRLCAPAEEPLLYASKTFATSEAAYPYAARQGACRDVPGNPAAPPGALTASKPGFIYVDPDPAAIMTALINNGPLVAYFNVKNAFYSYAGGEW